MDPSFYFFCALCLVIFSVASYFLRETIKELSQSLAANAKTHALEYIETACLMAISGGGAFATAYQALPKSMQDAMSWAPYVIFFWVPFSAMAGVVVAITRSKSRAAKPVQSPAP